MNDSQTEGWVTKRKRYWLAALALCLAGLLLGVSMSAPGRASVQTADPVLVGAGDIANCSRSGDEATALLLDNITGTVFTLGDNVYPDGTPAQFEDCYDPTWGRHKARTRPAPGNHDYHVAGAAGYYAYFGEAASPLESQCSSNCQGYYSYDLGAWHIIVLNSEIDRSAGSEQEQWLRADLADHEQVCTLAYWHKPRFSSGRHGNSESARPFWQALYEAGADVVLNGHDHTYERFAPQDPDGVADSAHGLRQFIVGTGGANLYSFDSVAANSEARNNTTWGVLKLTLHPTGYDWEFIPVAGQDFSDTGSADCVNAPGSATATPSATSTPSPTNTPTLATGTPTATATATPSATGSLTATRTLTPTATATVPPTASSTATGTATATNTPTNTSTATSSPTLTETPTFAPTADTPEPVRTAWLDFLPIVVR